MSRTLKVVQYNIWESKHIADVEAFLREEDPDIVTMQEVTCGHFYDNSRSDAFIQLKSNLGFHGVFAPTVVKKENGLQGNAILSKFPIVSHRVSFLTNELAHSGEYGGDITKEPRAALAAEIVIDRLRLHVATTHLTFSQGFNPSDLQLRQARRLAETLRALRSGPLLFGGDLNAPPGSEVVALLERDFTNVLEGADFLTFAKHPFVFDGFEVADLQYLIDFLFVTDDIAVRDIDVRDTAASDHLPLVARIEVGSSVQGRS